jgi:hypothetical protein
MSAGRHSSLSSQLWVSSFQVFVISGPVISCQTSGASPQLSGADPPSRRHAPCQMHRWSPNHVCRSYVVTSGCRVPTTTCRPQCFRRFSPRAFAAITTSTALYVVRRETISRCEWEGAAAALCGSGLHFVHDNFGPAFTRHCGLRPHWKPVWRITLDSRAIIRRLQT